MREIDLAAKRISALTEQLAHTITATNLPYPKYTGKVRDLYTLDEHCLMVATDRLSAFDRAITSIPSKGQVLNQLSHFWFEKTRHIIANHFISSPQPNAMEVKKCTVYPIEVVVRQYLTGSTNTAVWSLYQQGQRDFFGHKLADNLSKNSRLKHPILTPTTKNSSHDVPLSQKMLDSGQWVSAKDWFIIKKAALALFSFGCEVAENSGLILVDTKYEFGKDEAGNILLVDEIHTPDSSRFWEKSSYDEAFKQGKEPKGFDKEVIRLWLRAHANPYDDEILPKVPDSLRVTLAASYISLYERLTGHAFITHPV